MLLRTQQPCRLEKCFRFFRYDHWSSRLPELSRSYRNNQPFPHIELADFLDHELAAQVAAEFSSSDQQDQSAWVEYRHYNENKLGNSQRGAFPPRLGLLVDELNSPKFAALLSELTGIEGLFADPSLDGGGMHQTTRGGYLNIHSDFTHHRHFPGWRRRCNLILYLNDGWQPEWGGSLEFWSADMARCVATYPPLLNHAVVFTTSEQAYHGYPEPISPPPEVTRKSLALYYYTKDQEDSEPRRATTYRPRPQDKGKAMLIAFDNMLVAAYGRLRRSLRLSDEVVSKILRLFPR